MDRKLNLYYTLMRLPLHRFSGNLVHSFTNIPNFWPIFQTEYLCNSVLFSETFYIINTLKQHQLVK